jgi:hypothetical protein
MPPAEVFVAKMKERVRDMVDDVLIGMCARGV